jgi:hypothetical protein
MPATTTVELSDEIRAALKDEARFLAATTGGEIEHVDRVADRGEAASEVLKAQAVRLQLAIELWESVETGRLGLMARVQYLDDMVRLVETAREGELRELDTDRDYLREVIIRGPHPRDGMSREENIAYYRGQIEQIKARIRGQEAFLALAAADKERTAWFVAEEAAER